MVGVGSAVVGFIQFDSIDKGLLVGASLVRDPRPRRQPADAVVDGRASRMSPFAVFVGVLAFGWLWGAVGLILGTPILMVVKAICDRVEELKPVGECSAPEQAPAARRAAGDAGGDLGGAAPGRRAPGARRARRGRRPRREHGPEQPRPEARLARRPPAARSAASSIGEGAERRLSEARPLAVELRHDGAHRQRAGRRVARAGEQAKRRLALRREDERGERGMDDEAALRRRRATRRARRARGAGSGRATGRAIAGELPTSPPRSSR